MALEVTNAKGPTAPISFSLRGESRANPYWFDKDEKDPGPGMVSLAREIQRNQSGRGQLSLRLARLYQDRRVPSVYASLGSTSSAIDDIAAPQRVSWNLIRAACDVAHARVGRNRGRVMFVSVDGDWSLRRKARLRTRFVDGAFRQAKVYEEWRKVFLDGTVFGLGLLYVDSDEQGKLRSERVIPGEVFVDAGEGIDARPRTIYRRKRMNKREAIRLFAGKPKDDDHAKKVAAIMGATLNNVSLGEQSTEKTETIDVWLGWRLPSSHGAGDGRHTIAVEGCTLHDEEWTRMRFPFVPFRWGNALAGWYGLGVAEQLEGTQLEIRRTLYTIQQGHYHGSQFKILAQAGKGLTAQQFNNDPRGAVIFHEGAAPQFIAPSGVSPELPQHLERLWRQGFDQVGLPPSGSGAVPTNIKSGEGIRAYTEAVDSRLAVPSQVCDQWFVDVAEVLLDEVREVGDVKVESKVGRSYQRIDWKEIASGDDDFILQAWPASLLPATPSGRYDRLNEMVQAQWISKEQALSILDVPDLEGIVSLETASFEVLSRALELMLDDGKPQSPEPYQNLTLSLRMAQDAYLKARTDGCPEDRLQLVRDYIDAIRELQTAAQPPAPAAPPPADPSMPPDPSMTGPAGPMAAPMAA